MDCLGSGLLFVTLAIILTIWYRKRRQNFNVFKDLNIPGPEPNIIYGNLKEFNSLGNVKALQKWTKQYGKIFGYFTGASPFLVISDADICKQVQIKDFHSFADRPILVKGGLSGNTKFSNHVISASGQRWKEQRAILTPNFTTGKIKKMMPLMVDSIEVLMEKISQEAKSGSSFDIADMFKGLTMDVIARTAFGTETNVQKNSDDPFLIGAKTFLKAGGFSGFLLFAICFPELVFIVRPLMRIYRKISSFFATNSFAMFTDSCSEIVKARRSNPENRRDDLLQLMLDAEMSRHEINKVSINDLTAGYESGNAASVQVDAKESIVSGVRSVKSRANYHMNDDEVLSNAFIMIFAGYETTSTALAYITHILVNDQVVQEKMRQEILDVIAEDGQLDYNGVSKLKYLDQVFSETLRYYPPVATFVNRKTQTETRYGDLVIPKDMSVQIPVPIIHRDPDYWVEPDKFDDERFSLENRSNINMSAYQPFGAGPRNCVGMRFAQLEAKLALAYLLKDYRIVPCESTERNDIEVVFKFSVMAPKNGVIVKAEKL